MRFGLLIILFLNGADPSVSEVDFSTEQNCLGALEALEAAFATKKVEPGAVVLQCIDRGPAIR